MPAGLSFEEAAALPVAGLTALNGLGRCGDLKGKAVVVVGATGGVGVVFDAHGGLGFQAAARVLSERGVYATTLAGPGAFLRHLWQRLAGGKQLALANLRDRPEDYAELAQLVASGAVKPVVRRVFPLEQAAEAFAAQEAGGTVGKVVIRVG
jgi:NADPH2:quinone reductase